MAANAPQAPALPPAPPVFTVRDAMVVCGVNDETLFDGDTAAQRVAADLFGDDFATCMDKSFTELDSEFKTYSDLTQNQGQVRLLPGTKRMIKAFIQWVRDERRLGRDPSSRAFPVAEVPNLLRRYKTHEQYKKKATTLSDAAKPEKFTLIPELRKDHPWKGWRTSQVRLP
jgi:hypothetical protein